MQKRGRIIPEGELLLKPSQNPPAGRVWLIDEVRGLSILLMVVYHTLYDLVFLFGVRIPPFTSPVVNGLVYLFAGLFIAISGTASHYSRSNLKRGALCFGLGLLLTIGTLLILPGERILFGILHLLGICMMLFPLFRPLLRAVHPAVGMAVCFLLILLTFDVQAGHLGIPGLFRLPLPRVLYDIKLLMPLGFPWPGFFSSDYFPLLPWLFCFLFGGFFGVLVKEHRLPDWVYRPHIRPLAFVGRHTIWIYLLHQPVVFGVLWVIFAILGQV